MAQIDIKAVGTDYRWSGPQRIYWIGQAPVSTILSAAKRKLAHHKQRWDHWNKELAKATKAVKASVEIRTHQVTGGVQNVPVLDQEKAEYLNLCKRKVEGHQQDIATFTSYVGLLTAMKAGESLPISREDAELFGLGEKASA